MTCFEKCTLDAHFVVFTFNYPETPFLPNGKILLIRKAIAPNFQYHLKERNRLDHQQLNQLGEPERGMCA